MRTSNIECSRRDAEMQKNILFVNFFIPCASAPLREKLEVHFLI